MWNISRGFKFAHDVEDRQTEGKLGKLLRSGGENLPFCIRVQFALSQETIV
jgi:hypothetical protein